MWKNGEKKLRGEYGYSSISAVVGATYPEQLKEIRKTAPHTYFLIPGYGAQGGKAEDIALGFDKQGLGGIVNASRSLMCAYKSDRWKDQYTEEQYARSNTSRSIKNERRIKFLFIKNINKLKNYFINYSINMHKD